MSPPALRLRWFGGIAVVGVGPHAAGEPVPSGVGLVELCAGNRGVVVDLAGCDVFTSELLGHMIRAHRAAQVAGSRLCVCCPHGAVGEALDAVRLGRVLPIFETLAEALADFEP